jgi:PAS domain S-box-containing protein/diguanylate cyclase (GGDEF)-like protein
MTPRFGLSTRRPVGHVAPQERHARSMLAAIVESSGDAIISTRLDGTVTSWNQGAEQVYGFTSEEIIGLNVSIVYPPDLIANFSESLAAVGRGESVPPLETVRRRKDGSLIDVEVRVSPIYDRGSRVVGASAVIRDITERKVAETRLRESRDLLERTQALGHIGCWSATWGETDDLYWTPEMYRIFGLEEGPITEHQIIELVHPDDRVLATEASARSYVEGRRHEFEMRIVRPDGELRWLYAVAEPSSNSDGVATGLIGLMQDVTERKEAEARLSYDALHDPLTGLPNQVLLLDRVARALTRARRSGTKVAVLSVELDRFGVLNDTLGDQEGNRLLQLGAERLTALVGATDTVARFGPEEFVLVCEGFSDASYGMDRANDVLDAFSERFILPSGEAFVTVSIGVTVGGPAASADTIVRDAGLARDRAKQLGGNRVEQYQKLLRHQARHRMETETGLRRALVNDELMLQYQPIVSLAENRFVGVEALIRWAHPERGLVPPGEFIGVAEDVGLIVPIGSWVLETACRQLRSWREAGVGGADWTMSVNVSAAQFMEEGFPDLVLSAVDRAGLAPSDLNLELTESTIMMVEVSGQVVQRLRDAGVRIVIDDFGTGYSSLSYLKLLRVDELKIDRSFIEGLGNAEYDSAIVSGITGIARSLGLTVTAEGVETEAQLAEVRRHGCDNAQGYHLGRPVDPDACLALLRAGLEAARS